VNARDLAAGAALTIGIVGAAWAWLDRSSSVDVLVGRSAGDRDCEIMWLGELCIVRL
jgi:hypothetical protein